MAKRQFTGNWCRTASEQYTLKLKRRVEYHRLLLSKVHKAANNLAIATLAYKRDLWQARLLCRSTKNDSKLHRQWKRVCDARREFESVSGKENTNG